MSKSNTTQLKQPDIYAVLFFKFTCWGGVEAAAVVLDSERLEGGHVGFDVVVDFVVVDRGGDTLGGVVGGVTVVWCVCIAPGLVVLGVGLLLLLALKLVALPVEVLVGEWEDAELRAETEGSLVSPASLDAVDYNTTHNTTLYNWIQI